MSNLTAYEVRVLVKGEHPMGYNSKDACCFFKETIKMFHQFARTSRQAMDKCRKYGRPISAHKVNVLAMFGNFEKLQLDNVYQTGDKIYKGEAVYQESAPVYKSGDAVYQKSAIKNEIMKNKRERRINDKIKDKGSIDK